MGLRRYIALRSVYTITLLVIVVCFSFFLFQILPFAVSCPGRSFDSCGASLYLPSVPSNSVVASAQIYAERAAVIQLYDFNSSAWNRLWHYIQAMFTFNFGYNVGGEGGGGTVVGNLQGRVPYTLVLLGTSTAAAFIIGTAFGVVAAAKRGKKTPAISPPASLLFAIALPVLLLGLLLTFIQRQLTGTFYVPVGTATVLKTGAEFWVRYLQALFLPFLTLTLAGIEVVFLTERTAMVDAVAEDYVLMARAKGLRERTVLYKHALRNDAHPITRVFALSVGFMLSAEVITEIGFGWPGLGQAIWIAALTNDLPLAQGAFFMIALVLLACFFASDIAYGLLDPRVSTG